MLSGKFSKIGEIRFSQQNVQHRVLGFFWPGRGEFILLMGAIEKDNKFIPKNAPEQAIERMEIALKEREWLDEHKI